MKKIIYSIAILLISLLNVACGDETSEGVSRITNYAEITLKGEALQIIPVGGSYTDEGAVATEAGKEIPYKTESTVDNQEIGVYYITYTAVNADGFSKSEARAVIVKSATPPTDDFTGKYRRNAGAKGISTWTKLEDGVFSVTDVGGSGNAAASVYVLSIATNQFIVPEQYLGGAIGDVVSCDNGAGNPTINYVAGSPDLYKWRVLNSGYGAAVRTFEKQ